MQTDTSMEKIVSLAKRRGFVYPGSDIYGGLANAWDYGPLGVELKNNIKKQWWKDFVHKRLDVVGLDSAILMNPEVWKASGHIGGFSDPLMDCKSCKSRFRADKLLEDYYLEKNQSEITEGLSNTALKEKIDSAGIQCPRCGTKDFTDIRQFNLMFKTFQGVNEDTASAIYLRPETAQGIFVNFKNAQISSRNKLPFGIAQIGKSFRNEITPGNFIFRTREFEQMELEYFTNPEDSGATFLEWKNFCHNWLNNIGLTDDRLRIREHSEEELSHYSNATTDIEFKFPFGWGELWGIAHRGDYDLTQHQTHSKKDLHYHDTTSGNRILPHVIEPSLGVDRLALAILINAYEEEKLENDTRLVLRISKFLAPYKVAILPLSKKLSPTAKEVFQKISEHYSTDFDETGSIGKRYRRQDEIGTPFCLTVDFETSENETVTFRDRDSMQQERISIVNSLSYLRDKFGF